MLKIDTISILELEKLNSDNLYGIFFWILLLHQYSLIDRHFDSIRQYSCRGEETIAESC